MQPSKLKSVIKRMEARELCIHPFAQRRLVLANLKRLKQNLDLDAIGVIHAVQYEIEGKLAIWVIDGQTRIRALVDSGLGEWIVEVKIHLDATDDERASALFLKLNNRSPVSPFDKFENELRAAMPEAIGVSEISKAHGLKIARHGGDGTISSVSALKRIFREDGGKSLSATLGIITGAWGRSPAALEGKIIEGISILVQRYNGKMEIPSLVSVLSKYPAGPSKLLGSARGLTEFSKMSLSKSVAQVVLTRYNYHRRSGTLDPL